MCSFCLHSVQRLCNHTELHCRCMGMAKNGPGEGLQQMIPLPASYPRKLDNNLRPGYDIDPDDSPSTQPCLPSLELQPSTHGSSTEGVRPEVRHNSPSFCLSEDIQPTPAPCIALTQVTHTSSPITPGSLPLVEDRSRLSLGSDKANN